MSTNVGPKAIVKPNAPVKIKPAIFREYIGVKPYPSHLTDFPDIINTSIQEFHFILGFASELYDNNGRGTGNFRRTWIVDYFTAEKIRKLKQDHGNVKVSISIGGVGTEYPFNPAEIDEWHKNAIASLRWIIHEYNKVNDNIIDGIDINYEVIQSNDIDFANCIGQVIRGLRSHGVINLASIAPSDQVQALYSKLYEDHEGDIDLVNYKFYNQTVASTAEFKRLYCRLSNVYNPAKLLAGFSTDPDVNGVTLDVFLGGCIDLLYAKSLRGIFVWNAHDSAVPRPTPFWVEDIAQKLLTIPSF